MALSAAQVWEVRTTGSDTQGGGFKAGATGTDYSQQDAAQVTYTDLVIDATTNTKLTSAGTPFTSAHVGNVINITGGTGFTTGRYEVVSVAAGVATMDRAVGTTSSTGGTGKLGGALASLNTLASSMVFGNKAWVKSGTYSHTAVATFAQSGTPSNTASATEIIGYASTRGDITFASANQSSRPLFSTNSSNIAGISITGAGTNVWHLQFGVGTGTWATIASGGNQNFAGIFNCKFTGNGGGGTGAAIFGFATVQNCECTGALSNNAHISTCPIVENCWIHDGAGAGVTAVANARIQGCVISNITGASNDGIQLTNTSIAEFNTVYNCARHGITITLSLFGPVMARGNILANNGGYGISQITGAGTPANVQWDGNAFYSNTSGSRNNLDDTGSTTPVNASGPYTNAYDVTLTADPFTAKGSNDYSLNTTAGGGAACRAVAPGNTLPGLSTTGYRDFGAIQHQDPVVVARTPFMKVLGA